VSVDSPAYPGGVLTARKPSVWRSRYVIALDGQDITSWQPSSWRSSTAFLLDGRRYTVRANLWGSRYELASDPGGPVAVAEGIRRKHWSVTAGAQRYDFQRASAFRSEQRLLGPGGVAGTVRRANSWKGSAEADLPGLPLPVQVFVLIVLLTTWDANAAAAAS
jgi:hypothetical protein